MSRMMSSSRGATSDARKATLEASTFPILCDSCLGPTPLLRMQKDTTGRPCKVCERPFTVYRWRPGGADAGARHKKTEICAACARLKNVCQTCILDLVHGLPVAVRDASLPTGTAQLTVAPATAASRGYVAAQTDRAIAAGEVDALYAAPEANGLAAQLARRGPSYGRNRARLCSFFAKEGGCSRGVYCPYRHELPGSGRGGGGWAPGGTPPVAGGGGSAATTASGGGNGGAAAGAAAPPALTADPLAKQNLRDRYYGTNDPVAEQMLRRAAEAAKAAQAAEAAADARRAADAGRGGRGGGSVARGGYPPRGRGGRGDAPSRAASRASHAGSNGVGSGGSGGGGGGGGWHSRVEGGRAAGGRGAGAGYGGASQGRGAGYGAGRGGGGGRPGVRPFLAGIPPGGAASAAAAVGEPPLVRYRLFRVLVTRNNKSPVRAPVFSRFP
ncbi:hypothetical protein I4F81_009521 [Pyropia yezoensis]|uniref:Uncharacterized protein n=1 Tax=Pyropia yezoensis TaxID=2788 RepID=A0ACC3CAN5_PYRYE|nr:hypothetical protein I4F81_009521 [Neopyropia yezoensis]